MQQQAASKRLLFLLQAVSSRVSVRYPDEFTIFASYLLTIKKKAVKKLTIKWGFLALLLLLFVGCNDSDDTTFTFSRGAGVYILQSNDTETARFSPYALFMVNNGTLLSGSVQKNGVALRGGEVLDNVYETIPEFNFLLPEVKGTYLFVAESLAGEEISQQINIDIDKALGTMEVTQFEYTDGKVVAKLNSVENATSYALFFNPEVTGFPPYSRINGRFQFFEKESNATEQTLEFAYDSSEMSADKVRVSVVAIYATATSTLMLHGEERVLSKGGTGFDD